MSHVATNIMLTKFQMLKLLFFVILIIIIVSSFLANMPETPRLLSLGMNGILSKLRQVEPGEAE
jgi:hypothetical protein